MAEIMKNIGTVLFLMLTGVLTTVAALLLAMGLGIEIDEIALIKLCAVALPITILFWRRALYENKVKEDTQNLGD